MKNFVPTLVPARNSKKALIGNNQGFFLAYKKAINLPLSFQAV
ncbi:MAG: hypothetical protein RJA86_249 [Pseudomonadota bacterium]|jgi:hypothetical protein